MYSEEEIEVLHIEPVSGTKHFSWVDYLVFGSMLLVSATIGIYHGISSRFRRHTNPASSESGEFLTANGQLGMLPVAISMLASFLSSITLMGQPAEVYLYGPQLWIFGIASFLCIPVVGYVFIPFYNKMKFTSAYEYFGQRFHRYFQFATSLMFTIQMVLYLALVLYAPALALNQVTGLNTDVVVSLMYIVVIFYTTIGGIKAVVWSDCFQILVLYSSMFAVLVKGTVDIGGINIVLERNANMGRSDFFNLNPNPTNRYTFWGTLIGAAFLHMSVYAANQLQVQRYQTVGSVTQARRMLWVNCVGWSVVVLLTVYAGMLIFARYSNCDPIASHMISKADQLFPLYVMDTLGDYVGFPGLFVSGIFSAGLSTVSTGLNSMAAIWWAELDGTAFKKQLSEHQSGLAVKMLALIFGLLSYVLVFVVPYMGGLAPVTISISSFFSGSFFGLFILGMFVPWANTAGATAGLMAGIGIVGWLTVGGQVVSDKGQSLHTPLPTSTDGCTMMNITSPSPPSRSDEAAFVLYRISFLWYSLLAVILTVCVGTVVSILYRWMFCENIRISDHPSAVLKQPSVNSSLPEASACKLLLKEGVKDDKALKVSCQGRIPTVTECDRDV